MKKHIFKCGHLGLGSYCHRCQQAEAAMKTANDTKELKKLAKERNTEPEKLAAYFKEKAEQLKSVPKKPAGTAGTAA